MAAGGFLAIVYLLIRGIATKETLSGFLMAWGNTYGLILIVLLLGHGVSFPRGLAVCEWCDRLHTTRATPFKRNPSTAHECASMHRMHLTSNTCLDTMVFAYRGTAHLWGLVAVMFVLLLCFM